MLIKDLKKDILWKEFGIIYNKFYEIETDKEIIQCKILNFDTNQFALNTIKGFMILHRRCVRSMRIINMSEYDFTKAQDEYLMKIGFEVE